MRQEELDGKRVVVALGGNALGSTPDEQLKLLESTAKHLAAMVKEGINVVVTHGNGPQVGVIDEAFVLASRDKTSQVPFMPLSDCNVMSQGYIGAQLTCALIILTAVEKVYVNFNKPDQRAIDVMTAEEARALCEQGQFAPGSMLPKVEACIKFVEAHPGGVALITALGHAAEGLRGETGTLITGTAS